MTCGDDGCGGSCGSCSGGATCSSGQCVYPQTSWANVYPLFQNGCTATGCHSGARPAEGLDFSTSSTGYAGLVNVASTQCSGKKRVAPNDLANSYLWNKLTGAGLCFGTQMPKAGSSLPQSALDTVQAWINTGAKP